MPQRPDLRQIAGDIRTALDGYDRDALAEILTYVFKEYVVESPPPLLVHQTERMEDLRALSFPELITALQTRLDLPELALFQVQGDQVMVRVGGALTPLSAREVRGAAAPAEVPPPGAPTPTPSRAPAPSRQSVDEATSRGRGDLVGAGRGVVEAPPPRPGGLRVSGRPAPTPGGGAPAGPRRDAPVAPDEVVSPAPGARSELAEPAPANPAAAPVPPARGETPAKPEPSDDDDASIRFSLLELD
jgi:hypothetical protein